MHIDVIPADVVSCKQNNWLNSTAVYCSSLMLKHKAKLADSRVAIMDPLIASLIYHEEDDEDLAQLIEHSGSATQSRILLIPLNNQTVSDKSGDHWSLLLRVLLLSQSSSEPRFLFFHICSLNRSVPSLGVTVAQKLQKYTLNSKHLSGKCLDTSAKIWEVSLGETRQRNSSDCGVFVVGFVLRVLEGLERIEGVLDGGDTGLYRDLEHVQNREDDESLEGLSREERVRGVVAEVLGRAGGLEEEKIRELRGMIHELLVSTQGSN